MRAVSLLFKLIVWMGVLAIPVTGVWVASSMAAMLNGPVWLTALCGALLFPVLPLSWELWAWRKRRRAARSKGSSFFEDLESSRRQKRTALRTGDRMLLRTLALNGLFLGGLLVWRPQAASTALTARGDWMLDSVDAPWTDDARAVLHHIAELSTWLYEAADDNPYADLGTKTTPAPALPPVPEEEPVPTEAPVPTEDLSWQPEIWLSLRSYPDSTISSLRTNFGTDVVEDADRLTERLTTEKWLEDDQRVAWTDTDDGPELVILEGLVVASTEVASITRHPPVFRIELHEQGQATLCETTRAHPGYRLVVTAPDQPARRVPILEAICDGTVSVGIDPRRRPGTTTKAPVLTTEPAFDHWPLAATPHPLVTDLPDAHAQSISAVGSYLAAHEPDPFQRVKALHDYVALHVVYDTRSLKPGRRAPQDADTVFRTGKGVCAGYANLLVALGEAADVEIAYVVGHSRDDEGGVSGHGHAWNAARIEGQWHLIDATWNAGFVNGDRFKARYSTSYLFTPPEFFRVNHLPDEEGWQLAAPALSRGEFTRQPILRAGFYAAGLTLVSPDRSHVTVDDRAALTIDNPRERHLMVTVGKGATARKCTVRGRQRLEVSCSLPETGEYELHIYENEREQGAYTGVGRLLVNAR